MLLNFYHQLTSCAAGPLRVLLKYRVSLGKEDPVRYIEKMGIINHPRPKGHLIWLHAASVGEAASALSVIEKILAAHKSAHIMVTSGTLTSAKMLESRLPKRSFHQYVPLDHPAWTAAFLDHWQPDTVLWLESELWPNMLGALKKRHIPAILLNARLSHKSFRHWKKIRKSAAEILSAFEIILCQNEQAVSYFTKLGAANVVCSGNLKFSAAPLPCDEDNFRALKTAIGTRPLWLYASTHYGEERLAGDIHHHLKETYPDLLTIIAPRHPTRGVSILQNLEVADLSCVRRADEGRLPTGDTDIYIADTLGELGLLYRLCPIAVIGRSFSDDGGGGHNPIEAVQLGCAVISGPQTQNLQEIYDQLHDGGACLIVPTKEALQETLQQFLAQPKTLEKAQQRAHAFSKRENNALDIVWQHISPFIQPHKNKKDAAA